MNDIVVRMISNFIYLFFLSKRGAGRDGKDFYKALQPQYQSRVICFVDVDPQKLQHGFYEPPPVGTIATNSSSSSTQKTKKDKRNRKKQSRRRIPIVHFSYLAKDTESRNRLWEQFIEMNFNTDTTKETTIDEIKFGRINKSKPTTVTTEKDKKKHSHTNDQLVKDDNKSSSDTISKPIITSSSSSRQDGQATYKKRKINNDDTKEIHRKFPIIPTELLQTLPKLPVIVCVAMYRTNGVLEQNVKLINRSEGINLWHFS